MPKTTRAVVPPPIRFHVVAADFGMKEHLRQLRHQLPGDRRPATTRRARASLDDVFLSNGQAIGCVDYGIAAIRLCASAGPVFGICVSATRSWGSRSAKTFKLPFGHHGGNHPVLDKTTGKVEITSQNHGFAVDPQSLPSGVHITHDNLFDHSVEGIAVAGKPIFSVQYHPEASPGPHDASYLFARFRDQLNKAR
jgi:carbamoyl-phosphate synthase small subunit